MTQGGSTGAARRGGGRQAGRRGIAEMIGPGFKFSFAYDAELRANSRSHTLQAQLKLRW